MGCVALWDVLHCGMCCIVGSVALWGALHCGERCIVGCVALWGALYCGERCIVGCAQSPVEQQLSRRTEGWIHFSFTKHVKVGRHFCHLSAAQHPLTSGRKITPFLESDSCHGNTVKQFD